MLRAVFLNSCIFWGRVIIKYMFLLSLSSVAHADIAGVGKLGKSAPLWVRENPSIFERIDESPFSGFFLENNPGLSKLRRSDFFPFIDRYGQFIHSDWPGKIHSDLDFLQAIQEERRFEAALPPLPNRDLYGGYLSPKFSYPSKGFFSTRKVGGKWFFVTPLGNLFWSLGVNAFNASSGTRLSGREAYFSPDSNIGDPRYLERLPFDRTKSDFFRFYARNSDIKYGSDAQAAFGANMRRLDIWGFNTLGTWFNLGGFAEARKPYLVMLGYSAPFIAGSVQAPALPDFFSASFERAAAEDAEKIRGDILNPMCLGVFAGYKMSWQNTERLKNLGPLLMSSGASQEAKIEFAEMLKKKYASIGELNLAWGAAYESWNSFLSVRDFYPKTESAKSDFADFTILYAERFFEVFANVIKKINPDALFWGSRMPVRVDNAVLVAASRHCDVVGMANYPDSPERALLPPGADDKPVVVCEFNFCAQDRGVFGGGYAPVKTTEGAAEKLDAFLKSAVLHPAIAGAHWMRWIDPPTSAKHNGENTASGLIDCCDTPIYPLVSVFRKYSDNLYNMRLNKQW